MMIKASGDVWVNLVLLPGVNLVQNGTDWEVRAGLTASGQLIRTLSSKTAAESFVAQMLGETGLSAL